MLEKIKITPKLAMVLLSAFVVIMVGMWFFNMPVFGSANRDKQNRDMMRAVKRGDTEYHVNVQTQFDEIPGEELGYDDSEFAMEDGDDSADVVLEGTINIPKIGLDVPLLAGATRKNMRYSVCFDTGSDRPGKEGNCIIFGHRMKKFGRHFNRLDELSDGDKIIVTMGGKKYTYVVDDVRPKLEPREMLRLMGLNNNGRRISLVTCTPLGVGSHRLVVMGELLSVKDA